MWRGRLRPGQPVADTAHGLQPTGRLLIVAELTADVPDMDLDSAFIRVTDVGIIGVLPGPDRADQASP